VPLGLELSEYENLPERGTFKSQYPKTIEKKIIFFFGRINFKKGIWCISSNSGRLHRYNKRMIVE